MNQDQRSSGRMQREAYAVLIRHAAHADLSAGPSLALSREHEPTLRDCPCLSLIHDNRIRHSCEIEESCVRRSRRSYHLPMHRASTSRTGYG